MSTPFEDRAAPNPQAKQQFAADCRSVFSTPAGARVLARLCMGQHPMMHWAGMTAHEHGAAEVVATLWRYGAGPNQEIPHPEQ